jgi:hypothetical protein
MEKQLTLQKQQSIEILNHLKLRKSSRRSYHVGYTLEWTFTIQLPHLPIHPPTPIHYKDPIYTLIPSTHSIWTKLLYWQTHSPQTKLDIQKPLRRRETRRKEQRRKKRSTTKALTQYQHKYDVLKDKKKLEHLYGFIATPDKPSHLHFQHAIYTTMVQT